MEALKRLGRACMAMLVACALSMPCAAIAWAAQGGALVAASPDASSSAPFDADVDADVWDGAVDITWFTGHEDDTSYTLTKPAQLAGLAALVNGTVEAPGVDTKTQVGLKFAGKTVRLGADIVLNVTPAEGVDETGTQRSWTPIGDLKLTGTEPSSDGGTMPHYDDANYFDGTFDGAGHVIKNLYIYNNVEGTYGGVQALFANVGGNALICNVGIDDGFVSGRVAAGLVAVSHASQTSYPYIIGCFNSADVVGNGSTTRGVAGIFAGEEQYRGADDYHGGAYIANCYNTGTISRYSTSSAPAGGIAGTGSVQIYGCYSTGVVDVSSMHAGALAGNLLGAGSVVGQGAEGAFEGASCVVDSYALEGGVLADDRGIVKLYNYFDATHYKGGAGENNPAVAASDTAAFKEGAWFAGDEANLAISQSFVKGVTSPQLYWQAGQTQWDFERIDTTYNVPFYEVWGIANQPYTGSELRPKVTVSYEVGALSVSQTVYLHEGSDYTVSYANNREIGSKATVTVTGMGRFYGVQTTTFSIVDSSLDSTTVEPILAQWYYGEPVVPEVVVKASNGDVLVQDKDYSLEVTGNVPEDGKDTCTATATITPTVDEKFTGSKSVTFTVLRASQGLSDADSDGYYEIASKADLQFLAHETSEAAGSALWGARNFELTGDVDATSSDATYATDRPVDPLFTYYAVDGEQRSGGFSGVFDGAGHTVTLGLGEQGPSLDLHPALAFAVYTKYQGSATFKDLTIDGFVSCPHGAAAGFLVMGQPGAIVFEGCVNKATVKGDAYYSGSASGFITQTSMQTDLHMIRCTNEGEVSSASSRAAGFVGALGGQNVMFEECVNAGAVTSGSMDGAGGLVCTVLGVSGADEPTATMAFRDCTNKGRIYVRSGGDAGGIMAKCAEGIKQLSFTRCANVGEVSYTGSGDIGGGIVGRTYNPTSFLNCYSNAPIKARGSSSNQPGGIVGYLGCGDAASVAVTMENVYATGNLGTGSLQGGGLVGVIWLHVKLDFVNAYYDSDVAKAAIAYNFGEEWPSAVDPPVVNGQAAGVDGAAMKSVTFATMLGAAFAADAANANGGCPVLASSGAVSKSLADASVSAPATLSYTGAPLALEGLAVKNAEGEQLVEDRDYVVFYVLDGSHGRAVVEGIGSYTGSLVHEFTLEPCKISSCTISQVNSVNYADFAGTGATQPLTLTNPSGSAMAEGSDYTVSYAKNMGAGVAYLRIEGKAPYYTGSVMRMFSIEAGDLSALAVGNIDAHYPASNGSAGLYVYEELYAPNGYRLHRSDSSSAHRDYIRLFFDADGKLVTDASGAAATSITKAGSYTVVLKGDGTDASGANWNNGNWTGEAQASFTYGNRMAQDANVGNVAATYGYTGRDIAVKPSVASKITGYALSEGVDYTLAYKLDGQDVASVRDPGDYTLVVAGRGTWFGAREIPFTVVASEYYIDDSVAVAGVDARYLTNGAPIAPVPTSVSIGAKKLDPLSEYAISYEDATGKAIGAPTKAGTYYLVVTGLDPYKGTKRVKFSVEDPYISVYKATPSGKVELARAFSADELAALKSNGGAVSGLYCGQNGTGWHVASTDNYVTLGDVLLAAGVKWAAGASVTYGGDSTKSSTSFTYEQVQKLMFYPGTTASATETLGAKPAPFVLALSSASTRIGDGGTTYASEAEQLNLRNAGTETSPRAIMGVLPDDYANPKARASAMMGVRLWNKVASLTVTEPASDTKKSDSSASSGSKSGNTGGSAQTTGMPTSSQNSSTKPAAASSGSKSGSAGASASSTAPKANTAKSGTAKANNAKSSSTASTSKKASTAKKTTKAKATTKAKKAKKANTMTAKGKVVTVKYAKVKKKAVTLKAAKAFKVKKAKGKVTYKVAKYDKKAKKKITVNKAGKLTVKKGVKKGIYKLKVKVSAAGNASYKAKSKTVTVTVKVK